MSSSRAMESVETSMQSPMIYNPEVTCPAELTSRVDLEKSRVPELFCDTTTPLQTQTGVRFTRFKLKLAMVPLIFIFTRAWSETRTIILAVNPQLDAFWLQVPPKPTYALCVRVCVRVFACACCTRLCVCARVFVKILCFVLYVALTRRTAENFHMNRSIAHRPSTYD